MSDHLHLRTHVGHAGFDEHQYRGSPLFAKLAGNCSVHSILMLAAGGRKLAPAEVGIIDDLVTCSAAADPHIWPLKLARLGATHGEPLAGLAAAQYALAGAPIGPATAPRAAEMLLELGDASSSTPLPTLVERRLAAGGRFAGFGVPYRPADERVTALRRCLATRGFSGETYWPLAIELDTLLATDRRLPLNIAGAVAAVGLDFGFDAPTIHGLAVLCTLAPLLANAWEGAQQSAAVLQSLPREHIRYVGPAPRRSPRAKAGG